MSHYSLLVAVPASAVGNMDYVAEQMEPFRESSWFADGTRWDWYEIGGRFDSWFCGESAIRRDLINLDELREYFLKRAAEEWDRLAASNESEHMRTIIYGIPPGTTREQYLANAVDPVFPTHAAFLRDGAWHESERGGWFGMPAKTECEIKTGKKPKRCVTKAENGEAKIVTWNEAWPEWRARFYDRFIEPLPGDTVLVTVDYHI